MHTHTILSYVPHTSEEFSLINAAFQIIRGGIIPMDVATVHLEGGSRCYMTLLSSWGYVADVDIESEKWRSIGEFRFFLGGLHVPCHLLVLAICHWCLH